MTWTPPLGVHGGVTRKYGFTILVMFLVGCIYFFQPNRVRMPQYLSSFNDAGKQDAYYGALEYDYDPEAAVDEAAPAPIPSALAAGEWGHDHGEIGKWRGWRRDDH